MEKNEFDDISARARVEGRRFVVVSGSESGHCCFRATVVDTHAPDIINEGGNDCCYGYRTVCECFDCAKAEAVADALNASAS